MESNGSHTGGRLWLEYTTDDKRDRVERALDKLKESADKPGFRTVEVYYSNGRFHTRPRQSWSWENEE